MKKSQLRKIIRESIKELKGKKQPLNEQTSNCYSVVSCWPSIPPAYAALWGTSVNMNGMSHTWRLGSNLANLQVGDVFMGPPNAGLTYWPWIYTGIPWKVTAVHNHQGCTSYSSLNQQVSGGCSSTPAAPGCTDPSATNYDPSTTVSCWAQNPINPWATHSWVLANDPITSNCCEYGTPGCTDSQAINYNSNATQDDGSCDYGWRCQVGKDAGIFGCYQGNATNPGIYATQQACQSANSNIPNSCGGGGTGGQTVNCSKCQNGYAVSNIFQGTSCPQGWQLASLGDPCKSGGGGGPVPTDPILQTKKTDPQIDRMQQLAKIK